MDVIGAHMADGESPEEWMKDWRYSTTGDVSTNRDKCFEEVVLKANRFEAHGDAQRLYSNATVSDLDADASEKRYKALFMAYCLPAAKRLISTLKSRGSHKKYFVFAIDECSFLNQRSTSRLGQKHACSLLSLQRIVKAQDGILPDFHLWFTFINTDSHITNSSHHLMPSLRGV